MTCGSDTLQYQRYVS